MRTITAPGVEWKEIDRSGYSPAMTGTACYIRGFANKGEPYKPMEFTSRSAWLSYYGEPDNEAERYFYAAACEVLNQNGRLYCARLPYDNASFEKLVGVSYTVSTTNINNYISNALSGVDSDLQDIATISINGSMVYNLSDIDEYRTNEKKVDTNNFVIVDTTGATYGRVVEDERKGEKRECLGIVPIVTTAVNAMQAQQLIQFTTDSSLSNIDSNNGLVTLPVNYISAFETIKGDKIFALSASQPSELQNNSILATDSSTLFNTAGYWFEQKYEFQAYNFSYNINNEETYTDVNVNSLSITINNNISTIEDLNLSLPADDSAANSVALAFKAGEHAIGATISAAISNYRNVSANINMVSSDNIEDLYLINENTINIVDTGTENNQKTINGTILLPKFTITDNNGTIASVITKSSIWQGVSGDSSIPTTLALDANQYFPVIQPASDGSGLDPEHLKDIGVVVYKAYLNPAAGNKVSFEAVEAYCGSLYKDDVDPNTGVSKFIDTIINSQSRYINFFSNCFSSSATKKYYLDKCDVLYVNPGEIKTLGFYSYMTEEKISIAKSIYDGLYKSDEKAADINKFNIDIVCDAGIANIASFIKAIDPANGKTFYDLTITDDLGNSMLGLWKCDKATSEPVKTWKTVEQKFDNFCKNVRKDCMFIADGLRPLVLQGNKKIVRDSKPANTIDVNITPYLNAICGLNTSYGAGYVDWFEQADDYTGDFFWCPPSIKAMGVYINTDVNFNYWEAPAGLNRGMVAATDVAFSPTPKQAGIFYEKNWNYAINYPNDGIILEGQKTFQVKPSAFDRVNVRRLFLRLERASYQVARYFVYEGNTAYTRQRLVDALDPYFKEAKLGGGIYDYMIICDESINDPTTIDRNELKVKIGIKPVKAAEFILIDFIAGSTGASWDEIMK